MNRDYSNEVYVEVELENEVLVRGSVNKKELYQFRTYERSSFAFHRPSGTTIMSRHSINCVKEL